MILSPDNLYESIENENGTEIEHLLKILNVCLHFNNFLGNLINNKSPPVIEAKFVFIACFHCM